MTTKGCIIVILSNNEVNTMYETAFIFDKINCKKIDSEIIGIHSDMDLSAGEWSELSYKIISWDSLRITEISYSGNLDELDNCKKQINDDFFLIVDHNCKFKRNYIKF